MGSAIVPLPDDSEWQLPRSAPTDKHHGRTIATPAEAITKSTGEGAPATYIIPRSEAISLELATVLAPLEDGVNPHEIRSKKGKQTRQYWRDIGRPIGASRGVLTSYILVIYGIRGEVHGFPITAAELQRKGVTI